MLETFVVQEEKRPHGDSTSEEEVEELEEDANKRANMQTAYINEVTLVNIHMKEALTGIHAMEWQRAMLKRLSLIWNTELGK